MEAGRACRPTLDAMMTERVAMGSPWDVDWRSKRDKTID
jgi:hypothetical protein